MATAVAILSIAAGILATLFTLVMLMAGGANATPAHITQIKWMLLGVSVVGLLGLAGGVWGIVAGKPWLAAGIGAVPIVAVVTLIVVLVKLEW